MAEPIIRVENLGKCYRLQQGVPERYSALRDIVASQFKRLLNPSRREKFHHEDFWALKDVSFEVNPGEVVGIIGQNGAGKSTLLKIISRITEPTQGKITLNGRVASLLEVGTGFHPELTGRENIYLNGAILGMTRAEIVSQFDEIVAFAEVDRFLDTPVKRYSSGMYVRLAFSVAAHLHPEILVVDEVLAVGDAQFQQKCLGKMQDVATQSGRTVLFVSHNMDAVIRLCSRALLLQEGRVVFDGSPKGCVDRYGGILAERDECAELGSLTRPSHIRGGAMMQRATPKAASGQSSWAFPFGVDVEFDLVTELNLSLDQVVLGIGVFAPSGMEIASILTSDSLPAQNLGAGRYRFNIRFKGMRLVPGVYFFGIGVQSTRGLEDYLPKALSFSVASNDASSAMHTDQFRGYVVPSLDCTLVSLLA